MKQQYLERVVDLTDSATNEIWNLTVEEARQRILAGSPDAVREIAGSFAIVARESRTVRMARSLDRPMRYFLAKRAEGPALIVAERIDTIHAWLREEGLGEQFHPSYTRMVPAHYVVEIQLVGCPDPDPIYTRFFTPRQNVHPSDLDVIGSGYITALMKEISEWLRHLPSDAPIGVCFSGGVDSGAIFLTTYYAMQRLGLNLARLKAFTLSLGGGADLAQARTFLDRLGLSLFHEPIETDESALDLDGSIRLLEDYKPLDVECAAMGLALCRGIRARYPDWRHLIDGDGGDENLKDYPIEENPELTIHSVINNALLYHEGWGVGRIKHSLTYSGGISRSYARTYAPVRRCGFAGFSPFLRPAVVEIAEGIPFAELTGFDHRRLYALKGEIVGRGIKQVLGADMPIFEKRRFQHGAAGEIATRGRFAPETLALREADYRQRFFALYERSRQ